MANEVGKTEVDATVEEIVALQVQEVLTASAVLPGSVLDYSAQVGPGMDRLKIPRFTNFTVKTKAENTATTNEDLAFATDNLDLNQHKYVRFLVEDIASLQAKVAVVDQYVSQAARDLAAEMDAYVIGVIDAGVSAAAPDHILAAGSTRKDDIIAARETLNLANVPMDRRFMLIGPDVEAEILAITDFVEVQKYGSADAIQNGELGRLFGFQVLMSTQQASAEVLFYHPTTCAFARQLSPRVQRENDLDHLGQKVVIDHLYGAVSLDGGKRTVKVNASGA
jgi:hypothetical protein